MLYWWILKKVKHLILIDYDSVLQIIINLKRRDKCVALWNLSIYYTCKNTKKSYKNNKFKISAPSWNEKFELPDGSYFVLDIQDYFEYILKKHREKTDNLSIRIYRNKIENRTKFKIKTGCYLELLMYETMKSFGSSKRKITKDKNGENVPHYFSIFNIYTCKHKIPNHQSYVYLICLEIKKQ